MHVTPSKDILPEKGELFFLAIGLVRIIQCHVYKYIYWSFIMCLSPHTVWYGLLCVRGGIYNGAMFKFTLLIPANYPDGGCPVGYALIKPYPLAAA